MTDLMGRVPLLTIADGADVSASAPPPGAHVWHDLDSTIIAWGQSAGGEHVMHWPGLATFHFSPGSAEITARLFPGARHDIVRDIFLRSVAPMALQALGLEALHASAVLGPHGIVAFCAISRTGKSTLAFGLSRRGYPQWADDAVVLEGTRALPLPFIVRLRSRSAEHYNADEDYREVTPDTEARPLAAVFVLERAQEDASAVAIERLMASASFVSLLTHAYCFDPSDVERRAAMMRSYLELAARVPVFRLVVPNDLVRMPEVLDCVERLVHVESRRG